MRCNIFYLRQTGKNIVRQGLKLSMGLFLIMLALPAWSASLMLPSVHNLKPILRNTHHALPGPKPVVTSASYHLMTKCTNSLHAITVTVHIRNEGGPLKASMADIVISEVQHHVSAIWNANDGTSLIPALAPGQVYTTTLFVGTLPEYRKALPGSHTFYVEVIPNQPPDSYVYNNLPTSMYQFPVNIPAGYCQNRFTPLNSRTLRINRLKPVYPPSPCINADCNRENPIKFTRQHTQLRPCLGRDCLAGNQATRLNKRAIARFGASLKPNLQVVSVKFNSETLSANGDITNFRITAGTPIVAHVLVRNTGAIASKAGVLMHVFCSSFYSNTVNYVPTRWTCKVSAPGTSPGGMPMWNILLPAVPGHGQVNATLRIPEHWQEGTYYFTHSNPGQTVTISYLQHAKADGDMSVDK